MRSTILITAFILILVMFVKTSIGQTFIGGAYYQDLTLTKEESPYIVTENIILAESYVLTVEAGTEVLFEEEAGFRINGSIQLLGTPEDSIRFNVREETAERWSGITLLEQSEPDTITDIIQYSYFAKTSGTVITSRSRDSLRVEHCKFVDNLSHTIKLFSSNHTLIRNNEMQEGSYGIYVSSSQGDTRDIVIANNKISGFFSVGIFILGQDALTTNNIISENIIFDCLYGIQIDGGEKTHNNRFTENVLYNNNVAMYLYNGYNKLTGNTLFNNNYGVRIHGNNYSGGKHNQLRKNIFFENNEGIYLEDKAARNSIDSNLMYENTRGIFFSKGTVVDGEGNTITNNTFRSNDTADIVLDDAPQEQIAGNSFSGDFSTVFYLLDESDQNAPDNWWGTADSAEIEQRIYDKVEDTALGKVFFSPWMITPPNDPVPAPSRVIKQWVHDTLLVSWNRPDSGNIAGYRVYYKQRNKFQYEEVTEVTDTTFLKLPGKDIFEEVAVTAFNSSADGVGDQHEQNESWFVMAQMFPFAGKDTIICESEVLTFETATAFEYDSIRWIAEGMGNMVESDQLAASYVHDQEDVGREVVFRLLQYDSTTVKTDSMMVSYIPLPKVFAGADTTLLEDSALILQHANVLHADSLKWHSAGDGYFEEDTIPGATYFPGGEDNLNGQVELVLTAYSHCGMFTDTLIAHILPTYSLSGQVHYYGISGGAVNIFAGDSGSFMRMMNAELHPEKTFFIPAVPESNTYLLYMPDPQSEYLPTYYVNKTRWEEAYEILVDADVYDLDIQVQKPAYTIPQGAASLSGTVAVHSPESSFLPLIHLTDSAGRILRWDKPDPDNSYQFKELPFGRYRIGVEKPGVPYFLTDVITLSPEAASAENIHITIDGKEVKAAVKHETPVAAIFPVIVDDRLYIRFHSRIRNAEIVVTAMDGTTVQHQHINGAEAGEQFTLPLTHLAAGMYVVQITDSHQIITTKKIIKQ